MEANKPGWNDAMNGLPGLLGSGISETYELKRILIFLVDKLTTYKELELTIPVEVYSMMQAVYQYTQKWINKKIDNYNYWDKVGIIREQYREDTRFGIIGNELKVTMESIKEIIELFIKKVDVGLEKAKNYGNGLVPTFFIYEATDYETIKDDTGQVVISHYGLQNVKVKEFKAKALPYFLEAPARALKVIDKIEDAKKIYQQVKATDLYDRNLKMYKTSIKLDSESQEIGRIRAFTQGWQERESIFLHMTYKYLLGLLKAGLYREFFTEIKSNMVCFMEPEIYGRSVLENSSFIASSVNPNPKLHGQGFVARISGTTAEFIEYMVYDDGWKRWLQDARWKTDIILSTHIAGMVI